MPLFLLVPFRALLTSRLDMELSDDIKAAIVKHALEQPTLEVCGLLIRRFNAFCIVPCPNVSPQPSKSFLMRPSDYIARLKDGTLAGYYHSHPETPEIPSEADKKVSESANLPVVIYSLVTKAFSVYEPTGKEIPLLGRRFEFGIFDCVSLFTDYYQQKLGIQISEIPRSLKFITEGMDSFHQMTLARDMVLVNEEEPRLHDLICLSLGTASGACNHLAVYTGNGQIMHQLLYRPSEEVFYGGYWKKHTVGIYRHKSLYDKSSSPR